MAQPPVSQWVHPADQQYQPPPAPYGPPPGGPPRPDQRAFGNQPPGGYGGSGYGGASPAPAQPAAPPPITKGTKPKPAMSGLMGAGLGAAGGLGKSLHF